MPKRFNPYSEWLQVHSNSPRPTHYELLNVSPTESDTAVLESAADTQLKKLESLDPGSRNKLRDKVEKEIRRSLKVLSDAQARADYDQVLLNKSLSPKDIEPPSRKNSKRKITKEAVPTNADPAVPIAKPVSTARPLATPIGSPAPPMATPVAQPKPPQAVVPPATDKKFGEKNRPKKSKESTSSKKPIPAVTQPASREPEPEPHTKLNNQPPKRLSELSRPRKKSSAGWVLGFLMLAGVVSLAGYLASQYIDFGNPTGATDTVAANNDNPSNDDVKPEPENDSQNKNNEEKDLTFPQSPPFPVFEESELPEERKKRENPEESEAPPKAEPLDIPDETSEIPPVTNPTPPTTNPTPPVTNPKPTVQEIFSFDDLKTLPVAQQYELKNHFYNVKNLWRQQRFEEVPAIVSRIQTGPHGEELGAAILETNTKLRAFWERFARSCQEFPGRQIEIDDRVVGIVERRPNSIILRIAGTNRDYEHRFVPPGLIMAIADQVAEPDDFDYRLEKAAYYISQLSTYPKYSNRADELLTEFEDAQDVESELRLMSELKFWDLGETIGKEERVKYRTDRKLSDGLKEVFELTSTRRTPPAKALEVMRDILNAAATPSDGSHFGIEDTSDKQEQLQRRMAMLQMAGTCGVRSGYTPMVMDIVNEISFISSADKDAVLYESLIDLSQTAGLDQEHAKLYCEEVLFVARESSTYSPKELYRLCQAGLKVAEKQNLELFGIQLVNKLNSLANGN